MPPRTTTVCVAGPDVGRRQVVARALVEAIRRQGTAATLRRWRPPGRHRQRGPVRSLLTLVRAASTCRPVGRRRPGDGELVVVEGSWFDLLVHPWDHGIWPRAIGPGRLLLPVLPRVDVVVLVDDATGARPRPPAASDQWGPWAWSQYGSWLGRRVVDESRMGRHDTDALAAAVVAALDDDAPPAARRWARAPVSRGERDVRATVGPGSRAALRMPVTTTTSGRVAAAVNQALVSRGVAAPDTCPVDSLDELCARLGLSPTGMASFSSPERGRVTVAVADGELRAVLKVGARHDAGLRHEALVLDRLRPPADTFDIPQVLWSGVWDGQYVLATVAIDHEGLSELDLDAAADLCIALHHADRDGGPVVHGDLAPWNLLATGTRNTVLDWEHARFRAEPLVDLARFVVQWGAALDLDPEEVVALLCGTGTPGHRYLRAVGVDASLAPTLLRDHLRSEGCAPYVSRIAAALARRHGDVP